MIVEQRSRPKRGYVPLFVAICLFVLSTSTAFATDRIVTKTADTNDTVCDADCSLREAIVAANASGGTDRVILGTGQTYNLSLGALPVTAGVTIDGHGSTINRQGLTLDRVLNIQGPFAVTINDLTITGGVATGPLSLGGGIRIAGGGANVILNNCIVNGNSTAVESGASDDGGGIAVVGSYDAVSGVATLAALTLNNSSVTGNTGLNGGGILCVLCALTVTNSTISGNTASGGDGGGIDMVGNASTLSVSGSTLATNTVTGPLAQGGALSVPFGTSPSPLSRALSRSRIVSNTATTSSAISSTVGTVTATNNWWGCNFGPGVGDSNVTCAATPNGVSAGVTTAPYLVLRTSASPAAIARNATTTATADLTFNSTPADTSAGGTVPDLIVAAFSGTLGSFATPTATTTSGKATDVYTNGGASGTATLSAVVDGQTISTPLTVVNDPPTLNAIPDPPAILEDAGVQTVNLSGISAGGGESQPLTVTALSNNTALIPNPTVSYTSPNATGSLTYTPAANASGTATITVTVDDGGTGTHTATRTFTVTVTPVADTPSVTNATTNEDAQTTSGLVISRNVADGAEVTHFKITGITNGTLFQTDGTTPVANNAFITFAQGNAGLKFTPAANLFSPGTLFGFTVQGATDNAGGGLGTAAAASITVNPVADAPSVTGATTNEDTQTASGLVISRNAADGAEVTHFKITVITNGTLFQADGTTPIVNNAFITFAQGNAGLKFTPAANLFSPGTLFGFTVQGATDNAGGGLGAATAASIAVNPVGDTPSVTNATTLANVQTTSGLVISRNAVDGAEIGFFKITTITNGTLFQTNGTTPIANNAFITVAQGNAGLKFTPTTGGTATGNFQVQASVDGIGTGLSSGSATATIAVTKHATATTIVSDTPDPSNVNALVTVVYSVVSTDGGPTPTGTVTVTISGGGETCSATVAAGQCTVALTTAGTRTIAATYGGDAVSLGSAGTAPHAVNALPTIAPVPDQLVPLNGSAAIPLTVGDVETAASALVVTATSSNQTLVPNAGLVVSPGGASRTLTVTPAANRSGTATITVTVDDGTGGQTSTSFVATVATGLSIADATMAEGNSGTTNLSFTVSLTGSSASTVSAHYATRQRTAIEGVDYLGVAGTVSFAPGVTTATILVPIVGDTTTEIDETFFVELSGAAGGVISRAQAVGTIVNDDPTSPVTAEFVTWGRRAGVSTDGGSLTKTAAVGWTAAASPTKAVKIGDGSVEFSASAADQRYVLGVSRSTAPFLAVTDIELGLALFEDGTFTVVEHGVTQAGTMGTYAGGDRFAIAVTGGVLAYQRNGVTIYTSASTPVYPLRVDAALFTPGATIADVVLAGRLVRLGSTAGDVDGDGKSDLTVFRPSTGAWHTLQSSTNYTTSTSVSWGLSTDVPVPGDYDGDGKTDPAVFRPSTGLWAILKSSTNYTTSMTVSWGVSTDVPVPADYDGDGKTDPAVFRPSTGGWYILKSTTNYASSIGVSWGLSTDLPLPGDYDGDGQADPAIFRPSTGLWAILKSSTNYTTSMTVSWGVSTDVAVPGDYDGDGKIDPAVYRPSTGGWYMLKSSTNYGSSLNTTWGLSTDIPVPADYDGDGKYDPAIFRPSTSGWYILKSSTSYGSTINAVWGLSTDVPVNRRP